LASNRPPSAMQNMSRTPSNTGGSNIPQRATNGTRTWGAQGNVTDRGQSPQGFGRANGPAVGSTQTARTNQSNRPPWARGSQAGAAGSGSRGTPSFNSNRAPSSSGNHSYASPQPTSPSNSNRGYSQQRSYTPPSRGNSPSPRTYSAPSRSYSAPQRSYSAPSRSYSAPSRSYSAPSRSYSAPSHSSGGGSSGGGGGGSSHSGSGGSSSHAHH
jgi:hypothetical protein